MKINPIYKKLGNERRQYRKYAPWIFFLAEGLLTFEILYSVDLIVGIGNLFVIVFIGVMYFRMHKLFSILTRNDRLKSNKLKKKQNNFITPSLY
jgi:hypothetical protein